MVGGACCSVVEAEPPCHPLFITAATATAPRAGATADRAVGREAVLWPSVRAGRPWWPAAHRRRQGPVLAVGVEASSDDGGGVGPLGAGADDPWCTSPSPAPPPLRSVAAQRRSAPPARRGGGSRSVRRFAGGRRRRSDGGIHASGDSQVGSGSRRAAIAMRLPPAGRSREVDKRTGRWRSSNTSEGPVLVTDARRCSLSLRRPASSVCCGGDRAAETRRRRRYYCRRCRRHWRHRRWRAQRAGEAAACR